MYVSPSVVAFLRYVSAGPGRPATEALSCGLWWQEPPEASASKLPSSKRGTRLSDGDH